MYVLPNIDLTVPSWRTSRSSLSKDSNLAAVSASYFEAASMDCCRNCAICRFNSSLSPFKSSVSPFNFSFSSFRASAALFVASLIDVFDAMISALRYTKQDSEKNVTANVRRAQVISSKNSVFYFSSNLYSTPAISNECPCGGEILRAERACTAHNQKWTIRSNPYVQNSLDR